MPDQGYGTGRSGDPRKIIAAPHIAIVLESRTHQVQNAGRRWQFGLVIPKAFVGFGQLKIDTGFGPLKILRLSTLMFGEEFVPINVNGHYGVKWVSDEVDHEYRSAVQQDIEKIVPNDGYIFTGSGKIRTQIGILTWGENYIFVWKNSAYSIPETIDHYFIAENEGWRAAIVTLPTEQDDTIEAWLRDQFGAVVTAGVRQWGILYPPPLDRDSDGNIRVGALSELFLGFSDHDDDGWSEDTIAVQIEKQAVTIKRSADQKWVASIVIPLEQDNYPVTLTWGARTLQPILRERRPRFEQVVEIAFRIGGELAKAALHQIAAAALLRQVRAGRADIVSIHIPRGVAGTLDVRKETLAWTEIARLKGVGSASALNAEQLAVLTIWLRKQSVDVRVRFGCFGEFTASGENAVAPRTALSKTLRNQIEWYLRLTIQGSARYAIASWSDAAIVKAVSAPTQNPAAVSRQNLLLNELKIEMGATRER